MFARLARASRGRPAAENVGPMAASHYTGRIRRARRASATAGNRGPHCVVRLCIRGDALYWRRFPGSHRALAGRPDHRRNLCISRSGRRALRGAHPLGGRHADSCFSRNGYTAVGARAGVLGVPASDRRRAPSPTIARRDPPRNPRRRTRRTWSGSSRRWSKCARARCRTRAARQRSDRSAKAPGSSSATTA